MKHADLVNAVININGASFVGLDTHTDVTLAGGKKNPMQGRVTKRMIGASVMSFQNKNFSAYEAMVKRRLATEGKNPEDFKLSERAWGVRIPNMPIVEHKGNYYLEVIFMKPGNSTYYLDGAPIAPVDIIGLPVTNAGEQGGLDNKVILRTFAAESITELRIDGKVFN
jgi:hypothetical protein